VSFTSDLTVEEFVAIRSVGFEPVGQVMGGGVYDIRWDLTRCAYSWDDSRLSIATPLWPVTATQQRLSQAGHQAVERMRRECAELGGDGVVGVRLGVSQFHEIGLEFRAIGTAVRAAGPVRPRVPFTSNLSGQDFAKLLRAGWVPVAIVQGVGAMAQHGGRLRRFGVRSANQEIATTTRLVYAARDAARDALTVDTRHTGADHVVLRDSQLQVFERRCTSAEGEDQHANVFMGGTAVVPYARRPVPEPPLTMLRLNR
jgi:uncharacterized protein YbjQ (UPF0145 family)